MSGRVHLWKGYLMSHTFASTVVLSISAAATERAPACVYPLAPVSAQTNPYQSLV